MDENVLALERAYLLEESEDKRQEIVNQLVVLYNTFHKGKGPGGGQFTSKTGGSAGSSGKGPVKGGKTAFAGRSAKERIGKSVTYGALSGSIAAVGGALVASVVIGEPISSKDIANVMKLGAAAGGAVGVIKSAQQEVQIWRKERKEKKNLAEAKGFLPDLITALEAFRKDDSIEKFGLKNIGNANGAADAMKVLGFKLVEGQWIIGKDGVDRAVEILRKAASKG